jgi:hypothetical protein
LSTVLVGTDLSQSTQSLPSSPIDVLTIASAPAAGSALSIVQCPVVAAGVSPEGQVEGVDPAADADVSATIPVVLTAAGPINVTCEAYGGTTVEQLSGNLVATEVNRLVASN